MANYRDNKWTLVYDGAIEENAEDSAALIDQTLLILEGGADAGTEYQRSSMARSYWPMSGCAYAQGSQLAPQRSSLHAIWQLCPTSTCP